MIALLRGNLLSRTGGYGVIDVGGVGYQVFATNTTLERWAGDDEVTAHVSTQVREDSITLYGFATDQDRDAFLVLIGVSGVGPKMALSALDSLGLAELHKAVEADDVRTLTSISGVGKKTAQRLALELKGKLPVSFVPGLDAPKAAARKKADPLDLALARLGYTKSEIDRAHAGLDSASVDPEAPVGQRLGAALKVLSGGS